MRRIVRGEATDPGECPAIVGIDGIEIANQYVKGAIAIEVSNADSAADANAG